MKYKGIELKEFTSDKTVGFDPPKKRLVWDGIDELDEPLDDNDSIPVHAFLPRLCRTVITTHGYDFRHCAEIPYAIPCPYCSPRISDTTERKNYNYSPI